jgi:hypothetical protein
MMREGRFPQSRRIGKTAKAWLEEEVEDWIRKQANIDICINNAIVSAKKGEAQTD